MSGLAERGVAAIRGGSSPRVAALLALALVVAACGSGRVSGERRWVVRAQQAGGGELVVTAADRTGMVADVAVQPADWSPLADASFHARPGDPTSLGFTWLRQGCASALSILLERELGRIAAILHEDPARGCTGGSDPLPLVLRFRSPVDPSEVRLVWDSGDPATARSGRWYRRGGWHRRGGWR